MVGIGETYVPAFVLALGLGQVTAALVATLPILAGGVLQMFAPRILHRLRSPRSWVVGSAVVQGLALAPLAIVAIWGASPAWFVFLCVTVYWAFGLSGGPAWNQWVERLFPRSIRPGFFSRRSRWNQVALLGGLVAGGLVLRYADSIDAAVKALAGLDAFVARTSGVSAADPDPAVLDAFRAAMDDDLDTPKATALLFDTVRRANAALDAADESAAGLVAAAREIAKAFGLRLGTTVDVPADVLDQAAALDAARAAKDFATADAIRAALQAAGWTVETGKHGTTVRR